VSLYRLYFRDREGHFYGVRHFEAQDETQAIGRADRMARGFNRELWWENSLLRRWGDEAGDRPFERFPPTA
jgi:hypothetical protein